MHKSVMVSACVGVVVGCAAQQLVSFAPASAQQEQTLQSWEYTCFEASSAERAQEQLTIAGAAKWELAAATTTYGNDGIFCLKRPVR